MPKDLYCSWSSQIRGPWLCQPNSSMQYEADNTMYHATVGTAAAVSLAGGLFDFIGPVKTGAATVTAGAMAFTSDRFRVFDSGDRTAASTLNSHWLRCLTQNLHHQLTSSAVLYQVLPGAPDPPQHRRPTQVEPPRLVTSLTASALGLLPDSFEQFWRDSQNWDSLAEAHVNFLM